MAPVRVSVPVPILIKSSVPVPSCDMPLKVVELLLPPAVSTAPTEPALVTVPLPAREPIWLENPFRSRAPATTNADVGLNPVVESACKVAQLTMVVLPV